MLVGRPKLTLTFRVPFAGLTCFSTLADFPICGDAAGGERVFAHKSCTSGAVVEIRIDRKTLVGPCLAKSQNAISIKCFLCGISFQYLK